MGKHTRRRKHSSQGGNKRKLDSSSSIISDDSSPPISIDAGNCKTTTILRKIRHSDARIRDATLSALSVTLLSNNNDRRLSNDILRALSERITVDTDSSSAVAAAGCLLNYVQSSDANCAHLVDAHHLPPYNAEIVHLLLSRIARALSNIQKSKHPCIMEWRIVHISLQVLVALLESGENSTLEFIVGSNSSAHRYVLDDPTTTAQMTAMELLLYILNIAATGSVVLVPPLPLQNDGSNDNFTAERLLKAAVGGAFETTARMIHSALDAENGAWTQNILETRIPALSSQEEKQSAFDFFQFLIKNCNTIISDKGRLHIAGSLTIALRFYGNDTSSCLLHTILPILSNHLDEYDCQQPGISRTSVLIERVMTANANLENEEKDEKLEQSIEQEQEGKESAREIGRRLYNKRKSKTPEGASDANDAIMISKQDEQLNKEDANSPEDTKDVQSLYDEAVEEWTTFMFVLVLSLEIGTNMTSSLSHPNGVVQDNDEMEWESSDEMEEYMATTIMQDDSGPNQDEKYLFDQIEQSLFPDRVMNLMTHLTQTISTLFSSSEGADIPNLIFQQLYQVQSKCGACIGNMAASMYNWRIQETESRQILRTLIDAMQTIVRHTGTPASLTSCLSRAMVSVLRSRSIAIKEVDDKDLALLLSLLVRNNSETKDEEDEASETRLNAAVLLGIICSETHTEEVNASICHSLLNSIMNNDESVMVVGEILNVLMDMYADDDAYHTVFKNEGVLSKFQSILPTFRRRIKETSNLSPDDEENLREIALNASRFIKYKKNDSKNN